MDAKCRHESNNKVIRMNSENYYQDIWDRTENLPWCALVTTGRVGSDFFQSLLDSHPEIFVFNGILNFDNFWYKSFCIKSGQKIEPEDIVYEFIGHYIWKLKSKYDYIDQKDRLGENRNQSISLDVEQFRDHCTALLKLKPVTYRYFLQSIYISYSLTLNQPIDDKKIFFHHLHHIWNLENYLSVFSDSKIISMTRDPRASLVSGVKHWQRHNAELNHLKYVYSVLNRTIDDATILRNKKNDFKVLKLEDLGQEGILKSICHWLNINYNKCLMESTWANKRWWGDRLSLSKMDDREIGFSNKIIKNNWEKELGRIDKYIFNYLLNSRLVHLSYKYTKIKFRDHLLVMILIVFPTAYEIKYLSLKYLTKCLTDKKYRWIFYSFYYYFKREFLFYKMVMLY